jgi:hypothetical protein
MGGAEQKLVAGLRQHSNFWFGYLSRLMIIFCSFEDYMCVLKWGLRREEGSDCHCQLPPTTDILNEWAGVYMSTHEYIGGWDDG